MLPYSYQLYGPRGEMDAFEEAWAGCVMERGATSNAWGVQLRDGTVVVDPELESGAPMTPEVYERLRQAVRDKLKPVWGVNEAMRSLPADYSGGAIEPLPEGSGGKRELRDKVNELVAAVNTMTMRGD